MFFTPKNDKSNITPGYPNIPNTKTDTNTSTQVKAAATETTALQHPEPAANNPHTLKTHSPSGTDRVNSFFYLLIKISAK